MRLSLRFIIPLLIALGLAAYATVPLIEYQMLSWFSRDLDARASLIANWRRIPSSHSSTAATTSASRRISTA